MTTLTAASSHVAVQFARDVILLIACLPLAYYLVAMLAGWRFFFRQREKGPGSFTPEVSVLKPVRGVDFASHENFRSFCLQDYPKYEILFCVNDLDDAAVPLIRRLAEEFPQRSIRLLSNAPQLGSNHKVNNLALLASQAKFELLVQSDGDVRVGANYLREMAAPFERAETGVVSCFYRGVTQKNLWAEIEALGVATDFSAGVLVAQASIACLIRVRGTFRSFSVCIKEFNGPMAAGSRKSIRASTAARRTSGEGSSSAPIRCGVASPS